MQDMFAQQTEINFDRPVTKTMSFAQVRKDPKTLTIRQKIYELILSDGPITRNEISRTLDIGINVVCGRVGELLKLDAIKKGSVRKDRFTNKYNETLVVG